MPQPHHDDPPTDVPLSTPWIVPKDNEDLATDPIEFKKTVRIAVTGDVLLTATEVAVIDTPHFQRLRGVRQLGTTNLVYPTALHTRFDHSLGTLAIADEMVLAIARNAKSSKEERHITLAQRKLARMYALLHDVPHVPYGHTIEDEMGLFTRHDKNPHRIYHFLGPTSPIGRILGNAGGSGTQQPLPLPANRFYERLMRIYLWEDDPGERAARENSADWRSLSNWFSVDGNDAFIHDIVSNTVCADLLDYVARDNYFCNLGLSLEYRFLNYLYLKPKASKTPSHDAGEKKDGDAQGQKRRVFVRLWKKNEGRPRRDLLTDLTSLLDARYKIAERAYFHHAKVIAGAMLGRAIQEYHTPKREKNAVADTPPDAEHGPASPAGSPPDEDYLYEESDETLLKRLCEWEKGIEPKEGDSTATLRLATRLSRRVLHSAVAEYGDAKFKGEQDALQPALKPEALRTLSHPGTRRGFENWYAALLGRRPGEVLIYAPPAKMNMKVAQVNVEWEGEDTTLSEIDDPVVKPRLRTILTAHENLWCILLLLAPDMGDADSEEDAKWQRLEEIRWLKEAFRLDFLVPEGDEKKVQQELQHRHIIERRARRSISPLVERPRIDWKAYHSAVDMGVESLRQTARGTDRVELLRVAITRVEKVLRREG